MSTTWSSGETIPPPPYETVVAGDFSADSTFTFVDFLPECRDPGGIFSKPVFASFRTLVDRANDWLRRNPIGTIKTCESVEFKSKQDHFNPEKMTYWESGEYSTRYTRGLRLWIEKGRGSSQAPQQIGYLNLVPQEHESNNVFSSPSFENLHQVIGRFNSMIRSKPLPGRIINAETQEMKITRFSEFDPDRSTWVERGDIRTQFIFVIRVFYEMMEGRPEELGIADFLPQQVKSGGLLSLPDFEPFSNVVKRASDWCVQQQNIRFCNVQSLEIKVHRGKEPDTQRMSYTEHGERSTFYVRILRIVYAVCPAEYTHSPLRLLTCKTIRPVQLTEGVFTSEYGSLSDARNRLSAWVRATGAQIISAETSAMRLNSGGERKHGTEASFTYNQAEYSEYWIFVFRLYLNGYFRDPPPEMLPPVPEVIHQDCCAIL